ncbi:MAG: YdcF family protein [Gammaproteobacteria bacterium]|nr:YdcF family protein [Gammaproteobacteria bacterium]
MVVWHGVVNACVTPPGALLILMAAGFLAVWRWRVAGWTLLIGGWALLVMASLPVVATALARRVETVPALLRIPASAQAIVVLAAGRDRHAPEYGGRDTVGADTLVRLRYAAHLYRRRPLPILVSGGAPFGGTPDALLMRHVLIHAFHVPVRFVESRSRTTAQNARFSARILLRAHMRRVVLVTQAWHMRRAAALFAARGLTVIPAPTDFIRAGRRSRTVLGMLPSAHALAVSSLIIHEEIGTLWMQWRTLLPRWLAARINNP